MHTHRLSLILFSAATFAGATLPPCQTAYVPGQSYPTGTTVSRERQNWLSNWTTMETPGVQNWGGWSSCGPCEDGDSLVDTSGGSQLPDCWAQFKGGVTAVNEKVSLKGRNWLSNWQTSETPGVENWGGWADCGPCRERANTPPTAIVLSATTFALPVSAASPIAALSASDAEGGLMSWRMVSGIGADDNAAFSISNGILRAAAALPATAKTVWHIRIEVADPAGAVYAQAFTLQAAAVIPGLVSPDIYTRFRYPSISSFAVYSQGDIYFDRSTFVTGNVGTAASIFTTANVGTEYSVSCTGDLYADGNINLMQQSLVQGRLACAGKLVCGPAVVVGGRIDTLSPISTFSMTAPTYPSGTAAVSLGYNGKRSLAPGSYGKLSSTQQSRLTLRAGIYAFSSVALGYSDTILVDCKAGERVDVHVNGTFAAQHPLQIMFKGVARPLALHWYFHGSSPVTIPTTSSIMGVYVAPDAEIHFDHKATLIGAVFAKKVSTGQSVRITAPETLSDIVHSGFSLAPFFDRYVLNYLTIVSQAAQSILIKPLFAALRPGIELQSSLADSVLVLSDSTATARFTLFDRILNVAVDYTLQFRRSMQEAIYVRQTLVPGDGSSWASPLSDLQAAIDLAGKTGRRIFVAEGTYGAPSVPVGAGYASAGFHIRQGLEIVGGFKGTESDSKPMGSPYRTVLSGKMPTDTVSGLESYAWHVLFVETEKAAGSVRLSRLTIQDGRAAGAEIHSNGGGLLNLRSCLSLEEVIFRNNSALGNGGGLYAGMAPRVLKHCLFANNAADNGFGGGLFLTGTSALTVDASVFDGNRARNGGAFASDYAASTLINTVITQCSAALTGAAGWIRGGSMSLMHVTAAFNSSGFEYTQSQVAVANSILWNPDGSELHGDTATVRNSCVEGGIGGINIATADPLFAESSRPAGEDNEYGSFDDGLALSGESPFIAVLHDSLGSPKVDIMETGRSKPDYGAYEFFPLTNASANGCFRYYGTDLRKVAPIPTINNSNVWDMHALAKAGFGYVLRFETPWNKYLTDNIQVYVRSSEAGSPTLTYTFYRVSNGSGKCVYQAYVKNANGHYGKLTIPVMHKKVSGAYDNYNFLYLPANSKLTIEIPHSQF